MEERGREQENGRAENVMKDRGTKGRSGTEREEKPSAWTPPVIL